MIEATVVRTPDMALRPITGEDCDKLNAVPLGQPMKVKFTKRNKRSIQFHRLYWGGLISLAMQYWEPTGGLVSEAEENIIFKFSRWLDRQGGDTGAIVSASSDYLHELRKVRSSKITTVYKSSKQLHKWIKEECGYYDLVWTPTGPRKEVKSISFDAMSPEEFNEFYRCAFSVVWNFILSRTFENPEQAENAINNLMAMG